MYATLTMEKHY